MKVKIYTRTGDSGKTSLYGGTRVGKDNQRVVAYGTVDELNSLLGAAVSKIKDKKISDFLTGVQEDLFTAGSHLAGAKTDLSQFPERVEEMEKMIDRIDRKLPGLKNFILPGGAESAALLFYTRAVARRCERKLVRLNQEEPVDTRMLIYFNRLSDLLFEIARFINFKSGVKEKIWKRKSV